MNAVKEAEPKTEQWRPIAGFPGYQVSSLGRVMSFRRGDLMSSKILKPSRANKQKRALVTMYQDDKPQYRLVARLVCEAFHGAPPSDIHQAAHEDGKVFNDEATNLSWKTPLENGNDKVRHGTSTRGEDHWCSKLVVAKVKAIRERYSNAKASGAVYGAVTALAKEYDVGIHCIEDIVYGRKWRHVS